MKKKGKKIKNERREYSKDNEKRNEFFPWKEEIKKMEILFIASCKLLLSRKWRKKEIKKMEIFHYAL